MIPFPYRPFSGSQRPSPVPVYITRLLLTAVPDRPVQLVKAAVPRRRIDDVITRALARSDGHIRGHPARTQDLRSCARRLLIAAFEVPLPQQLPGLRIERVDVVGNAGLDHDLFR